MRTTIAETLLSLTMQAAPQHTARVLAFVVSDKSTTPLRSRKAFNAAFADVPAADAMFAAAESGNLNAFRAAVGGAL